MSNLLYGSRIAISFELVRGYIPSIVGLPQSKISDELLQAHQEQCARRALVQVENVRTPKVLSTEELKRDTPVYYLRRVPKPVWVPAIVRSVEEHIVLLSTSTSHSVKPVLAAFEDIRLRPKSNILQEIDEYDPIFPVSSDIIKDIPTEREAEGLEGLDNVEDEDVLEE